jgi:UDP-galactopyranose mutase
MTCRFDYIIVGSGITGATIARRLHDDGARVLVLERRNEIGGNVCDWVHPSGIRIHRYGPHYFRTNSDRLWQFVNRFADFDPYEATLLTLVDGVHEHWPVTSKYVERTCGLDWQPEFTGAATNFEDACLRIMPRQVYEKFIRGYTEKQWGVRARALSASLAGRFDVRQDNERRLSRHRYQEIPTLGYSAFMRSLLRGIPLETECDYLKHRDVFRPSVGLVFTGPIDEFFGFDEGNLLYRGQRRVHEYRPNVERAQPCGQVNNPDPNAGAHIRSLEWKHMLPEREARASEGTVVTREYPIWPTCPDEFEYPFPDAANQERYRRYAQRAERIPKLLMCGRLGEYRYYDMDQAMARALTLASRLMDSQPGSPRLVAHAGGA